MSINRLFNDLAVYALSMRVAGVKTVTKYLAPDLTVRLDLDKNSFDKRAKRLFYRLTVGRPNYAESKFIKLAKKAGEPFPIKKVQLRYRKKK